MDEQSQPPGPPAGDGSSRRPPPFDREARKRTLPPNSGIKPPTVVSLPVRDGMRAVDLPLEQGHAGLETLARPSVADLDSDSDVTGDPSSELSVVFKGVHHTEPHLHPDHAQAPKAARPNPKKTLPPPPPAPPASSRPPPPGPDSSQQEVKRLVLPQPPRLPGELSPPPLHQGLEEDYDDQADTTVMLATLAQDGSLQPRPAPPPSYGADSIQPVEMRAITAPPRPRKNTRPRKPSWLLLAAAAIGGGGAIALGAMWLDSERGELVVDVSDQQCGAVDEVKVYVDDELVCESSPCTLQLASGSHVVRAEADGYVLSPPHPVYVDPKVPTLHKVQFGATTGTGVAVNSQMSGLSLYLDGKLIGDLPQRVTGLTEGEHTLLVSGGEEFYAEERKVNLEGDQVLVIDDIELKPRFGTLRIGDSEDLGDATVTIDDKEVELPYSEKLDAAKRYHVVATRAGYDKFETWVEFGVGDRDKSLVIELEKKHGGESETQGEDEEQSSSRRHRAAPRSFSASSGEDDSSQDNSSSSGSAATGAAQLNLTSDPPSLVLLDGKPVGRTPRIGLSVSPGTHNVVFIHPTKGRARASANLKAGQTKSLRARF